MKRSFVIVTIITLVFTVLSFQKVSSVPPGGDCNPDFEICFDDGDDPGDLGDSPTIVVDTTSFEMYLFDDVIYPNCTAHDVEDGVFSCSRIGSVDNATIGDYEIRFEATDSDGNTTLSESMTITVTLKYNLPVANSGVYMNIGDVFDYALYTNGDTEILEWIYEDDEAIFYQFEINEDNSSNVSDVISIKLESIQSSGVDLYLYDINGELITSSTNSDAIDELIEIYAIRGSYIIEVRSDSSNVRYILSIDGLDFYDIIEIEPDVSYQMDGTSVYLIEYGDVRYIDSYLIYYIPISAIYEEIISQHEQWENEIFLDTTHETVAEEIEDVLGISAAATGVFVGLSNPLAGMVIGTAGLIKMIADDIEERNTIAQREMLDLVMLEENRGMYLEIKLFELEVEEVMGRKPGIYTMSWKLHESNELPFSYPGQYDYRNYYRVNGLDTAAIFAKAFEESK